MKNDKRLLLCALVLTLLFFLTGWLEAQGPMATEGLPEVPMSPMVGGSKGW
jgi:hypothetical protein